MRSAPPGWSRPDHVSERCASSRVRLDLAILVEAQADAAIDGDEVERRRRDRAELAVEGLCSLRVDLFDGVELRRRGNELAQCRICGDGRPVSAMRSLRTAGVMSGLASGAA